MTNERAVEPEPIDAEFEPKGKPRARTSRAFGAPPPLRSRSASRIELLIASIAATAIGATMAIIVTNANSGASTGTLASELDALRSGQDEIGARMGQMSSDVVTLRSRLEAQADRLDRQDQGELALRGEISAVTAQVSALIGAGSGNADTPGAVANNSPLGKLLARITKLEAALSTDASAPQTSRQMQRSIADLAAQVTTLQAANANLSAAIDQRQAALAALEDGMKVLSSEVGVLRGRAGDAQKFGTGVGVLRKPTVDLSKPGQAGKAEAAATESRTIRAFSALESAAQKYTPFVAQQEALAALLPQDADVAALSAPAMHGVPSIEQLRREFNNAANNAGRLMGDQADDGWNWLRATFPGFGDTREAEADHSVDAAVVKARRSLEAGDARNALQAIAALPAPASGAFAQWREKAQRRADVDDRLAALSRRLLGAASAASGGG